MPSQITWAYSENLLGACHERRRTEKGVSRPACHGDVYSPKPAKALDISSSAIQQMTFIFFMYQTLILTPSKHINLSPTVTGPTRSQSASSCQL
jgi:hypothetical protein